MEGLVCYNSSMLINNTHRTGMSSLYGNTRKIQPATKTEFMKNNIYYDFMFSKPEKDKKFDTILCYCPACKERIEVKIYYNEGSNDCFQLVNIPERLSVKIDERKLYCEKCKNTIILEKQSKTINSTFLLKLDCSEMQPGMESWYEDSIPKHREGEYEL